MQNHDNNNIKSAAVHLNIQRLQRLIQYSIVQQLGLLCFTVCLKST